jgi:Skp family chaperone for outer membrane proteins
MKKLPLIIIFIFTAYQVKAQLAVVNSQKVLASVPAIAKTDTLIAKETAGYAAEYNKKQIVLNQLVKVADSLYKLDAKSTITSKAIADAQAADKDMKAYAETSNKKLAEYKQLLQKPYIDKVMAAIKAVALRLKYMQVIDSSSVGVLYLNPVTDITEQVIKELKLN